MRSPHVVGFRSRMSRPRGFCVPMLTQRQVSDGCSPEGDPDQVKISEKQNQRDTLRSLGLHRIGDVVVREDNSQNRGYVRTVAHLVKVEEID